MRTDTLIKRIHHFTVQMTNGPLLPEDAEQFEAALDDLLARAPDTEKQVVQTLLDGLEEVDGARDVLLGELELQSELVFLGPDAEQAALLFALPLVFTAGDRIKDITWSTDEMQDIVHVLQESEVVSSHVQVGLLPRLFRPSELAAQSYGALQRLTVSLGEKILAAEPVRLELGILDELARHEAGFPWGSNEFVDLRLLVGVIVCHESDLDTVFPAVGPESVDGEIQELRLKVAQDEKDDGLQPAATSLTGLHQFAPRADDADEASAEAQERQAPGKTGDGTYWASAFCEAVTNAFASMFGCQGALLPDDFHESLRRGLEFWREHGLIHQIEVGFQDDEQVILHAKPFEGDTLQVGWDIYLVGEDGTARDHAPWEVLIHESPEDSAAILVALCEDSGWQLEQLEPLLGEQ